MTTRTLSWPTAIVILVAIVALAATAILGPLAGLDADTLATLLGAEGAIGATVAGLCRALLTPQPAERRRAQPIWREPQAGTQRDSDPPDGSALGVLLVAIVLSALHASGCSGSAIPATLVSVRCQETHIHHAGGGAGSEPTADVSTTQGGEDEERVTHQRRGTATVAIVDSDCTVTASPSPVTTGNAVETRDITPSVSVPVTAGAAVPGGTP